MCSLFSRLSSAINPPLLVYGWRDLHRLYTKNQARRLITLTLLTSLPLQTNAGVVLLYHHVDTTTPAITSISPTQFEKHLDIIESENFTVLPLNELVANAKEGSLTRKEVAITFDDAFISIYTEAFPRLRARNWPFTIFVAPPFVNTGSLYLTWGQLKEMAASGASIENHSTTHTHMVRRLPGEDALAWRTRMIHEVKAAEAHLAEHGFESSFFAYPYGEYNLELLEIIASLNLIGFGQQSGAIGPYSDQRLLPRYPLAGIYVGEQAFRDKLRSLALPVKPLVMKPLVDKNYRPPLHLTFLDETLNKSARLLWSRRFNGDRSNQTKPRHNTSGIPGWAFPYNCTLPRGNRYYWFSQLWLRKQDDGTWYPEP